MRNDQSSRTPHTHTSHKQLLAFLAQQSIDQSDQSAVQSNSPCRDFIHQRKGQRSHHLVLLPSVVCFFKKRSFPLSRSLFLPRDREHHPDCPALPSKESEFNRKIINHIQRNETNRFVVGLSLPKLTDRRLMTGERIVAPDLQG